MKYARIVGKKDFSKFEKRDLLRGLEANCKEGYTLVYQDRKGNLFDLQGFCMSKEKAKNIGQQFSDGSRLLIKGFMNVIRVRDCYHLFPMNGCFGFFQGLNLNQSNMTFQTMTPYEEECFYLVDDEKNTIYEVKEFSFDQDPTSFDLFSGTKPTVVFQSKKEFGFIYGGKFLPCDPRSSTIVDPMTKWLINQ